VGGVAFDRWSRPNKIIAVAPIFPFVRARAWPHPRISSQLLLDRFLTRVSLSLLPPSAIAPHSLSVSRKPEAGSSRSCICVSVVDPWGGCAGWWLRCCCSSSPSVSLLLAPAAPMLSKVCRVCACHLFFSTYQLLKNNCRNLSRVYSFIPFTRGSFASSLICVSWQ
jgi:hypothetical protein